MKRLQRSALVLLLLLTTLLVVAPVFAQKPSAAPKPKTREQILQEGRAARTPPPTLPERYLSSYLQLFPSEAAAYGDFAQAGNLEDLPPQRLLAWLKYNKALAKEVDSLLADPAIQGDARLDLHVVREQIRREILNYEILKQHQTNPLYWSSILSQATVFQLVREDRPAAERLEAAARRAEKITLLVSQTIANLSGGDPDEIAPEHIEGAVEVLHPLADFYRQGFAKAAQQLPAGPKRDKMAVRLAGAGNSAAAAIDTLFPFFERLAAKARGNPRLGNNYYPLFRAVTGLTETPQAVAKRARVALAEKRQESAEFCRSIWPKYLADTPLPEDEKQVLNLCFARVERDGAKNIDEFTADYRLLVDKAQAFVRQKGFFTLPPKLKVKISRSPAYLGGAAVGGIFPPGPFQPDSPALLFVPTPADDMPAEGQAAFFEDFNHHFNVMITPHETVPGHAAQMALAARLPAKVRTIFASGTYTEGWGSFAERIMLDQGWGDDLARVAHLKKQLENTARTLVDIAFHTEGWTREQATAFVRDEAMQEEQFAGNLWNRTLTRPGQITTYWIGYQQIYGLYQEAKARQGEQFVLKDFLDGMMKLGPVAVPFYRDVILPPVNEAPVPPAAADPAGSAAHP